MRLRALGSWVQMLTQVGWPWAALLTFLFPVSSCVNEVGVVLAAEVSVERAWNSAWHIVNVWCVFAMMMVVMMMMTVCLDTHLGEGQE